MLKILIAKISFYFNLIQFEIILMEFAFRIKMLQIHPLVRNFTIMNFIIDLMINYFLDQFISYFAIKITASEPFPNLTTVL